MSSALYTCLVLLVSATSVANAAPTIITNSGVISGTIETANSVRVEAFKDIPYAAAPVGNLRWRSPVPPASWNGTKVTTKFGAACPQGKNSFTEVYPVEISENCLFFGPSFQLTLFMYIQKLFSVSIRFR